MSDFLARKVRTYFKQLDFDNDGFLSKEDFEALADPHCNTRNFDDTLREKNRACFGHVWRLWMKSAASDDDGLLTPSIMLESVRQQKNDPEFKAAYLALCHQFFKLLDVNDDGFIEEDEYARSLAGIGFKDISVIRRAFESVDLDQDGKLSFEEFSIAAFEYFTSEDENSPSAFMWGPLVI